MSVAAILLASCSPAQYKVNPPPAAVEESSPVTDYELNKSVVKEAPEVVEEETVVVREIPESQKEGFMRIISDLRWDQLTSKKEWMSRFSECLNDQGYYAEPRQDWADLTNNFYYPNPNHNPSEYQLSERGWSHIREDQKCSNFSPASIPVNIEYVKFSSNSGTNSKTMTREIEFTFFDDSQSRAFKAALAQKYTYTTEGYCSTFTCWDLGEDIDISGSIKATPTPYTISLLDQVQLNTSDL